MSSGPHEGLLALADELLLSIVDFIDSRDTLCKLASTCRRFQGLAEPAIWRSLLVTKGFHAMQIATAMDSREIRTDYVQELVVRYRHEYRDGIQGLNHFIVHMKKLKHLMIESPCPNNVEWNDRADFDDWTRIDYAGLLEASVYPRKGVEPALPMLQSFTLHGHGPEERTFTFGRCAVLFLHSSLKRITISCTDFNANITHDDIKDRQRHSTPLTSLTLIECNVNVHFLDVVLSLPKALKELDIGERLHVFGGCIPSEDISTRTSRPAFLKALARQAHSLEHLSHIAGNLDYAAPHLLPENGAPGLRDLVNLRSLSLGIETMLLAHLMQDGYPSSLCSLKIMDVSWSNMNMGRGVSEEIIRHPDKVLRRCTEVVKSMSHPVDLSILFNNENAQAVLSTIPTPNVAMVLQSILQDRLRTPLYQLSNLLLSSSRSLRLLATTFSSHKSYIPPYMYGEDVPHETLFYHSDDFWRIRGINFRVMDDDLFVEEVKKKPKMCCVPCKTKPGRPGRGRLECHNSGDGSMCIHCERDKYVEGKDVECVYDDDLPAE